MEKINIYNSFRLLHEDYERIFEYIEPHDDNINTYSHRNYELLLRAATEFENICKQILSNKGYQKQSNEMNITDYRTILSYQEYEILQKSSVQISVWTPSDRNIEPFKDWYSSGKLFWYQQYNEVKHNRESMFRLASLENLTLAMCSFVLLCNAMYGQNFFTIATGGGPITQIGIESGRILIIPNTFYVVVESY